MTKKNKQKNKREMENKIKLIKKVRKLILKDFGRCPARHLTWSCISCLAGLVIDFLTEYEESAREK